MFLRLGTRDIPLTIVLGALAGLALLSVVTTVAVMAGRRSADTDGSVDEVSIPADQFDWIGVDDLITEDELARGTEPRWIRFRPLREHWTESDVEEHWIDPREIGIDVLENRVNESIHQRLEDVP